MDKLSYVMVMVSDMSRSVAFYRDVLGLRLRFESPGWSEFETGDTTLALHGGGAVTPGTDHQAAGTCTFGFYREDLDDACDRLREQGVRFTMEPVDRPQEGIRLAVCLDPDGLPISMARRLPVAAEPPGS